MSNTLIYFLKASKNNSYLENLISNIKKNESFYFNKINDLNYSFSASFNDFNSIAEASQYSESKISLIYYDVSSGYIRKRVYEYGYLTCNKCASFSIDLESEVYETCKLKSVSFQDELDTYIEQYGYDESNFPKIGGYISINKLTCNDEDILDWLDTKKENKFKVTNIEVFADGVWVDNCDYRIDIIDCICVQ